jgi:hypothetical protein
MGEGQRFVKPGIARRVDMRFPGSNRPSMPELRSQPRDDPETFQRSPWQPNAGEKTLQVLSTQHNVRRSILL